MVRVTEVTDIEQVRDGGGNLLYIEYLVAVFERDFRNIPGARVIGTEKVRVKKALGQTLDITHHNPVTEEEIEALTSTSHVDDVIIFAQSRVAARVNDTERTRKWQAEPLSR